MAQHDDESLITYMKPRRPKSPLPSPPHNYFMEDMLPARNGTQRTDYDGNAPGDPPGQLFPNSHNPQAWIIIDPARILPQAVTATHRRTAPHGTQTATSLAMRKAAKTVPRRLAEVCSPRFVDCGCDNKMTGNMLRPAYSFKR